jgi:hypothetical protein
VGRLVRVPHHCEAAYRTQFSCSKPTEVRWRHTSQQK